MSKNMYKTVKPALFQLVWQAVLSEACLYPDGIQVM